MDDEERLEGEEEMELDEASDGEDDDEENSGIPISPANSDQLLGPAPTPSTSQCLGFHADSLNTNARDAYNITPEEVFHDPLQYQKFPLPGGKPLHIRRGPGRPRKERPPGVPRGGGIRRGFGRGSARGKGMGYGRGIPRRTKSKDDDTHSESPSPLRIADDLSIDGESSGLERSMPAPEEPPFFPEQWPGKVCALCNLSERSQLGQGELLKLSIPEDFTPEKSTNRKETPESLVDVPVPGDKSPRASNSLGAVTCRRQKSLAKCRNPSLTNFTEPVEELTIVGYLEEPDLGIIFEPVGHYYVHQACALWTSSNHEISTEAISLTIVQASTRRCAYCMHYGAGTPCKVQSCNRYFHYPCAAASSCFQDIKSLSLFCSQHLGQVPLLLNGDGERIKCMNCLGMGDVSNLLMCSTCGHHYHGNCVGLALAPSVRAGWQCTNCRLCQVCRQPEELAKVMTCERCDKAYHPSCLRPIVTSIPKYGWKCKCCRVCTDCGSRTPGAGLSSRWHSHYTVCDSCYQQRNKGFSCPLCRKAYRAAAYREMVQCSSCKKFVHGNCDPEADPLTYQHRKSTKEDYEYVCLHCKNVALVKRKDSVEDYGGESSLTASQESLYGDGDSSELDYQASSEDVFLPLGLGKGKPFCASKIAKKRLGLAGGLVGRPKGVVGKLGYQKRQKMTEFGRKRGPKAKMRGIFGIPGLGLQRPVSDSNSKEEEPGLENRLVLCSAKDKFVLSQDICVMCGAIGTDQEGCLIACAQCGQCYHPYCANVKVTKVILQKGWRCLDCTVCEGCGERNDEGRLILCDDCDISYHIYCTDPPLECVPQGTWKCKWCAQCQTCGANDPGFNSNWQKNYTQCGPCSSHTACAACNDSYGEGDLIIQCIQCERWLHCLCDAIKTEAEAEKCAEEGYNCILCRPRDVPPPHILCNLTKAQPSKYMQQQQQLQQQLQQHQHQMQQQQQQQQQQLCRTSPPHQLVRSPEHEKASSQQYLVEGIFLSEAGMNHIKSLMSEHQITRKKRRKLAAVVDKDADIMATIESVVAGGSLDNSMEESIKLELLESKDEPSQVYKEGMVWAPRNDQPPPEGFSIYTTENGVSVLRRKRQRNLQKLGIGGFVVRLRGTRKDKDDDSEIPGDGLLNLGPSGVLGGDDKPRRKPQRRKPKTKLAECFPIYMQEAFFGRELMDTTKDKDLDSSSGSESERTASGNANTIQLSRDELQAMEQVKAKQEKEEEETAPPPAPQPQAPPPPQPQPAVTETPIKREEMVKEETSDTEALDDILPISSDLLDSDLVNTIMNEPDEDLAKATEAWDELDQASESTKDELRDILSPHFNIESMVRDTGLSNIASQDVEEMFKGVLTDESQESRESCGYPVPTQATQVSSTSTPLVSPSPHPVNVQPVSVPLGRPQVPANLPSVGQSNLNSPMSFPPPSPYHSEYSNSPQFSPAFSEPPSPWVNPEDEGSTPTSGTAAITYNQRTSIKMEADESLGNGATTASVLYANMNHPEWKAEYPIWSERYKQIVKKWRALPGDKKAPYVSQARENRAAIRMKKAQQEQDKLANRDRSNREAEQERQWKQLQALRQQQAHIQQQVIHDQRAHAIARVHRQLSEDGTPTINKDNTNTLNAPLASPQDGNALGPIAQSQASPRGQFAAPAMKVNRVIAPPNQHPNMPMRQQLSPLQQQPQQQQPQPQQPGQVTQVCRQMPGVTRGNFSHQQQPPSPFSPQAPQSPHDFPQSPASQAQPQPDHFQRFENTEGFGQASQVQTQTRTTPSYNSSPRNDVFPQPPGTPRPIFSTPVPRQNSHVYAPSRTPESYASPQPQAQQQPQQQQQPNQNQPPPSPSPSTVSPVPSYMSPRPEQRVDVQPAELFGQQPEVNRQLRDLLQRQQLFNKDMKPLGQTWSQDGQATSETSPQQYNSGHVQLQQHAQQPQNSPAEGTFRQPLPPGAARPRMPMQPNALLRNPIGLAPRHPNMANIDTARSQGIDPRTRMLLQRPPIPASVAQQFQNNQMLQHRMAGPRNQLPEVNYEVLQRFPDANQVQNIAQRIVRTGPNTVNQNVRMISTAGMVRPPILPTVNEANVTMSETSEIPDNVTAELEKLEQEGAPMVEVENVSAILGDLADDDDELLAEMGADFNILEYADPELDQLTGGEKSNIFDDLELEQDEVETKDEKQKKDIKDEEHKSKNLNDANVVENSEMNTTNTIQNTTSTTNVLTQAQTMTPMNQTAQTAQQTSSVMPQAHPQAAVVQQQMHQHVQQAAAMGRPMPPGTRLLSPDGAVGVVTSTNSVTVSYPSTFPGHPQRMPQQHMQVQQHPRMGIRPAGVPNVAGRVVSVSHMVGPRMPLAPPPPPPPYPGPPPPYPGPLQSCSQEQPLLLEELLEQEKREQEKQQQQQQQQQADTTTQSGALLSDIEFERLRADVLGSAPLSSPPQSIAAVSAVANQARPAVTGAQNWQQPVTDPARIATFNIPQLPAPPAPPDNILTEQDRQVQLQYEQWLNHQHQILTQQLKYYETEVQKLRKVRKSLNSKQRQCRKSGNELPENDAAELQRISTEQAMFQKHLDTSRKQSRQHGILIQEYRNKQQQLQQQQQQQQQPQTSEPCSPLMSPSQHSSPMHSPAALMSQSPGPGSVPPNILHSPVASMVQHSPGNSQSNSGTMSPHSTMQPSPRIGTPHSQPEESPFSPGTMSSQGLCGPTVQRMASPQHRAVATGRLTTSPGSSFVQDPQQMRMPQQMHVLPQRFVRPGAMTDASQRPRMQMPGSMLYGQRSPLGSPQSNQQPMMTQQQHQQMLQRQQMIQQQHEVSGISQENQNIINQRNLQMVQRQQSLQQQQQQQQQQQIMQKAPTSPMVPQPASSPSPKLHQQMQQSYNQPPSSPHPRSPMVQQTMGSPMLQQQLSQSSQPSSPMGNRVQSHPPSSPMVSQYQPPSPMSRNHPSTSPMLHQMTAAHHPPACQTPNSPMPRSPMVAGSPMQMQRRQSTGNSPAMPDRPQSVENPGTPRTPHTPHTPHSAYSSQNSSNHSMSDQQQLLQQQTSQNQQESNLSMDQNNRGGGNPHNPNNPIPLPVLFGRYGYFKLGLRGGSPMWSSKPESSKSKSAEGQLNNSEDKPNTSTVVHRKTGISQSKINSLVCADYNDFDDDSHTPPQTPPTTVEPKAASSSIANNSVMTLGSPSDKVESLPDTTDYDDDKTIINTEVTLSSTAQKDNDDIPVIEQFGDTDLDVISSSLEAEMQEEYVLFESDMVLSVDSNDSLSNALVNDNNEGHDLVQILEIEDSEPTHDVATFDDDLLPTQPNRNKKGLHLDIVRTMPVGKRLIPVTDTPESPDQEDLSVEPSPSIYMSHSPDQDLLVSLTESDIVILDPSSKSPDNAKISCDEESSEVNIIETSKIKDEITVSIANTSPESKSSTIIIDETKIVEQTKEKKSYSSFSFQEKISQIPSPNLLQASIGESSTKPLVTYSNISTKLTATSDTANKSLAKPTVVASTTNIIKELLTNTTIENQKPISTLSIISSVGTDAKSVVKLTQSSAKTINTNTGQIGNVILKADQIVAKKSPLSSTSSEMSQTLQSIVGKINTTIATTVVNHPTISLTEKINTVSSTLPTQLLQSKMPITTKTYEKTKTNATQIRSDIQSPSVTHTTSKITTKESSKQKVLISKSIESEVTKEKPKTMLTMLREEKTDASTVSVSSTAVNTSSANVIDEKKTDILNTTDELESMLEAIHNPDDDSVINGEQSLNKNKADARTLKRMSPVTDDLSLVNILENDVESITQCDSKDDASNKQVQKANKIDNINDSQDKTECKFKTIKDSENKQIESVETATQSDKFYIESRISEDKSIIEESSDDILDMLQNIISSKPEMQEDKSQKSSLIYQLETPLEALPLNILQDSLADLEQEAATSHSSSILEVEKQSYVLAKSTSNTEKTSSTTKTQEIVVSSGPSLSQTSTSSLALTTVKPVATTISINTIITTTATSTKTTVPHLSPLSQPTEIKSNTDNVSDQLRSLLSSLHSNTSQSYAQTNTQVSLTSSNTAGLVSVGTSNNYRIQTTSPNIVSSVNKTETSSTSGNITTNTTSSSTGKEIVAVSTSTVSNISKASNVSIESNPMLNAMLSSTNSLKSPLIGPLRTNTLLTSSSPQSSVQQRQAILQVAASASTANTVTGSRVGLSSVTSPTTTQQSTNKTSVATNSISLTSSILQSTLSQTPTLLHTQLTAGSSQYKTSTATTTTGATSSNTLPIDNKGADADSSVTNKSSLVKKDAEGLILKGLSSEKTATLKSDLESSKLNASSHRIEDSQNVLLKKLLQNTACATTSGASNSTQTTSYPNVPSLEAQLARPVPPTPPSLITPLLEEKLVTKPSSTKQILSRETSFLSHAVKSVSPPGKEEATKLTPAITSPLSTTITKPPVETLEKQSAKGALSVQQPSQQTISVSQQHTVQATESTSTSTKLITQQETATVNIQMNPTVESTTNSTVQAPPSSSTPPQQQLISAATSIPRPAIQSEPQQQSQQQQQDQQKQPQEQALVQQQHQLQHPQQPQQLQQQQMVTGNEPEDTVPSPSPQLISTVTGPITNPKCTSPAIQRSPSTISNVVASPAGELTNSPQYSNTTQPSVPQTTAQSMGRQAQLSQGTTAQHTVPLIEVKKELLDDVLSSGTSVQLTDTKDFFSAKDELIDGSIDDKNDLKKIKRRQYQQKRRQSQGKDASMAPQKKRSRKVSRLDEDYDTYIDNLMVQLRQLQSMAVLEPLLGKNYGVCPIFGSGDLTKFGGPLEYNTRTGELIGTYGNARLTGISDHYNTQPFGELEPLPPLPPVSTQRSFYDQEFPPLKLDDSDEKKENALMGRDIDTPDTIVSSSSPECVIPEFMHRFPGLKLIEDESDEESDWLKRISPVIPIISPIPIRLKPGHLKDVAKQDKENVGITRLSKSSSTFTENGNVTVTLTLNSQAADDIMGVLKDLANILNIAPPTGYQIIERTTTPPSQKLGLYRIKGKDGKEGAPIDIQSILNGAAKFCRHCDVVILNSLIRKKVSELPFLSKEEAEPGDELCFCSVTCYMQFALMHRTPSNTHDKAAAIVDHLCQKSETKFLEEDLKKIQEKKFLMKQAIGQMEPMDIDSIELELENRIKTEKDELESQHSRDSFIDEKRAKKHPVSDELSTDLVERPSKVWRGLRYKTWTTGAIQPSTKYKKPTDREITEMLFRMGVTVTFPLNTDDSRRCMFCQNIGDGAADGTARLLNFDVDKWVHLNCALWSEDVYETVNGALMNLELALQSAKNTNCIACQKPGATVKCFKIRCNSHYHLGCAIRDGCIFYKNKSTFCSQHIPKNEKDNELTTLSVYRRVYVNRDENKQIAAVMHHSDHNNLLRVGSLIFLSVGQLLPHQLANFHTVNHIYPVGYKIVRFYWSMRRPNKRCRYVCSIHDVSGRPEFRVLVQEPSQEDVELRDASPRAVWNRILEPLAELRRTSNSVQLFPRYVTGEDLFGLTEPAVVRVLESLPGIETLTDYKFKYGRNPLLELPLAINPSGCARTEPRLKNQLPWKRPHTQRTASSARATYAPASNSSGELACPYSKQFVHSKSSQYKKMKQDWRNNVYLARSKIQGLGLYAARDLEKHTMVIEYIGEIIRTELAETREKQYEARNRGIYMFRLDEDRVVDATLCGGLARYINHSCNPNCVAEIVEVERDLRIIIFAKRRILRGEELAYDYKFDIEDDQHKIACACGAPNCRKWMN